MCRIALGANTRQILRAVLREGLAVALAGVAGGLLCTKYSMVWVQAFSFEDDQYDAVLFAFIGLAAKISVAQYHLIISPLILLQSHVGTGKIGGGVTVTGISKIHCTCRIKSVHLSTKSRGWDHSIMCI